MADADYHHLTQCENLDDARLNLTETDYNDALADSASMTPASLQKAAIEKVCVCCGLFLFCVGKEWMEGSESGKADCYSVGPCFVPCSRFISCLVCLFLLLLFNYCSS